MRDYLRINNVYGKVNWGSSDKLYGIRYVNTLIRLTDEQIPYEDLLEFICCKLYALTKESVLVYLILYIFV